MKNVTPESERSKLPIPVQHDGSRGRPAYSDAVRDKILRYLRAGYTRAAAAGSAGVHRSTFFDWMAKDPEFAEQVEIAEEAAHGIYANRLAAQARAGSVRATAFWLERRRPDSWRERREVEFVLPEQAALGSVDDGDDYSRVQALLDEADRRAASAGDAGADVEDAPS